MPSAKARAAKAATAARIAAYNAAAAEAAALSNKSASAHVTPTIEAGKPSAMTISGLLPCETDNINNNVVGGNVTTAGVNMMMMRAAVPLMPLKPTLPSMLNLNTSPNLNRALSVGSVVVNAGGQSTHNASDEENIQPGVTCSAAVPSPKIEEKVVEMSGGHGSRPLSPILGNRDYDKDVRAYEIERQKVKKGVELAKRKAKKANAAYLAVGTGGGYGHGRGWSESGTGEGGKKEKVNPMDVDIEELLLAGKKTASSAKVSTSASPVNKTKAQPSGAGVEVSLSELVMRTQKKTRKVKEDDFEMISPIRSVIVLDDVPDPQDMDLDEPWEHVEREFEGIKKHNHTAGEASYASVLSGVMH